MNPVPDSEMKHLAIESLRYATSYLKTFRRCLAAEPKRFDNDLLYNFAVMSLEKFLIALLARYDFCASSHQPLMLFREAQKLDEGLTPGMKQTANLISSFDGICSMDSAGYRTPSMVDLQSMAEGLSAIGDLVAQRLQELD